MTVQIVVVLLFVLSVIICVALVIAAATAVLCCVVVVVVYNYKEKEKSKVNQLDVGNENDKQNSGSNDQHLEQVIKKSQSTKNKKTAITKQNDRCFDIDSLSQGKQ